MFEFWIKTNSPSNQHRCRLADHASRDFSLLVNFHVNVKNNITVSLSVIIGNNVGRYKNYLMSRAIGTFWLA
jgi:hypothetical protein